jgi:hypothetical protein
VGLFLLGQLPLTSHYTLNLISTKFAEVGVGYAFFNNYGYYVVVFAAP